MIQVVFFGTPAYAVPTLRALAADPRIDVSLVVTQPDRAAGRGHRLVAPPVKQTAEELGIPFIQPATLRDEAVRQQLRDQNADLFVVAAYGLIFSKAILEIPRRGCLNLHASILPHYRGAAPIPAAILSGDRETGVTLMKMERGLDTGPIVAVTRTPISYTDTTESLTARLATIGASLAVDTIPKLIAGQIEPVPQPALATAVRQLTKADGQIDWRKPADEIERQVRAMWPWPRAWTQSGDRLLQIHTASVAVRGSHLESAPDNSKSDIGTVRIVEGMPALVCGDGSLLIIQRGQISGGRPLAGGDLVRGRVVTNGEIFASAQSSAEPLIRRIEN